MEAMFEEFFKWSEKIRIPILLAAGNAPEKRLHQLIPQKFGTQDNMIITVGGVEKDGTFYRDTTKAESGQPGSMSVYAPARDIVVPAPGNNPHTGTSQATAIVVSLILHR
jgi:hypothetical protein